MQPITKSKQSGLGQASAQALSGLLVAVSPCHGKDNGTVPTTGAISLNQIHQEAGGSSGTQVSINDSDVRGKSWFARVRGSTPNSGSTQDFADFYYPRLFGADQSGTTYPARIWMNTETTYQGANHRTGYVFKLITSEAETVDSIPRTTMTLYVAQRFKRTALTQ